MALARGIHTSLDRRRDKRIPCFFVLLLKEISSISFNTISNTTRVKTGIKQHAEMENLSYPLLNEILSVILI